MKKLLLVVCLWSVLNAEEGMYPLSEIHKLDLKSKGFTISATDIYNPNGVSLVDASVNVGGASGSFISPEGLIITNHHVVFGAVQQASTVANDYVTNGFVARTREQEIPSKAITVRIIDSYRDVSKEMLAGVADTTDPIDRSKIMENNSRALVAEAEKKQKGVTASVAEMFAGKTYVLFIYKTIKDVRLVYVPPRAVGEFGGEDDNWVWPRHTGDFSFIRAYVGKDGNPAEYSPDNIPFKPKKYFRVNPNGVDEHDRVFILGYPGRTFRHQTSHYLEYERDIRLPYIQQRNARMIAQMEAAGKNNKDVYLTLAARMKSLANVEKNYRGKLKGFNNIPLVQNKQTEEAELQAYIEADKHRAAKYGTVLAEIKAVYDEMRSDAQRSNILGSIVGSSSLLTIGSTLIKFTDERQKPDSERQSIYMDKNIPQIRQQQRSGLRSFYLPIDKLFLKEILSDAARLPEAQQIPAVKALTGKASIDTFIDSAFAHTKLADTSFLNRAMEMTPEQLKNEHDPLLSFMFMLSDDVEMQNSASRKRSGMLNRLMGKLVDVKQEWKKKDFIPDANSTLRMTFGTIRGYSPADAVYYSPISTLQGVIEKTRGEAEYNTPEKIKELYRRKEFGRYKHPKLNTVPVAILYDMDTTGGNSGSPVLNAKGELVGVNFDRTFEATINDYAWDQSYSRSIGVDIRYVLWNAEKVGGADFLLKEIGVK